MCTVGSPLRRSSWSLLGAQKGPAFLTTQDVTGLLSNSVMVAAGVVLSLELACSGSQPDSYCSQDISGSCLNSLSWQLTMRAVMSDLLAPYRNQIPQEFDNWVILMIKAGIQR